MKAYIMLTLAFCFLALVFTGCAKKTMGKVAVNRMLSLDGNEDYVEVADSDSLDLVTAMTVEMWVQVSSLVGGHGNNFFGSHSRDVNIFLNKEWAYECGITAINIYLMPRQNFAFAFSGSFKKVVFGQVAYGIKDHLMNDTWTGRYENHGWNDGKQRLEFGRWCHVDITYNGVLANAYVDGVLTARYMVIGRIAQTDTVLRIGSRSRRGISLNEFHGQIDEVRVWNIVRTQEEIQATMNTPLTGQEEGLVGYWNFDDGTANDKTKHGNHGTLYGDAKIIEAIIPNSVP